MAIRLRKVENKWIALCAAESEPENEDIYIDDAIDHAIRVKFIKDYESEGINFGGSL